MKSGSKDMLTQNANALTDLTSLTNLSSLQIEQLLDKADEFAKNSLLKRSGIDIFQGYTQINLFFENSTRTRTSFEIAGQRLGLNIVNIDIAHSSVKKGETLLDTALTLNAMHPDLMVIRHSVEGTANFLANKLPCSIINAGDGTHEHPTQALLDALTIRQAKGHLKGLKIAICGDIAHSRVARSNITCLSSMGAEIRLIAPKALLTDDLAASNLEIFHSMEDGLKNVDVIMMLRLQKERMLAADLPDDKEYFKNFGLNEARLKLAKSDCVVLHPGPMNRGVEIASSIADGSQSLILKQVENGVFMRMAVIDALLSKKQKK